MEYTLKNDELFNIDGRKLGSKDKNGYTKIAISSGSRSKIKQWLLHRYIYTQAHGNIPNGYDVDHIDFNPSNNNIENLQLVTRQQHRDRRHKKGSISMRPSGRYQAQRNNKHIGMYSTKCGAQMAINLYYVNQIK